MVPLVANRLSPSEVKVLTMLADGCQHKNIAEALGIGVPCFKEKLRKCRIRFGAKTTIGLVARALRSGAIE